MIDKETIIEIKITDRDRKFILYCLSYYERNGIVDVGIKKKIEDIRNKLEEK